MFALEAMRLKICNPTASLYNNRTQLHAALEFACLDIIGKKLGVPVHALLGGKLRDRVAFASYLFFRYADPDDRQGRGAHGRAAGRARDGAEGEARLHARTSSRAACSRRTHELACYRALAQALPGEAHALRPERRAVASTTPSHFGQAIEDLRNDYFEDPVCGMRADEARCATSCRIPLATNTVVVNFEQLAANVVDRAPST